MRDCDRSIPWVSLFIDGKTFYKQVDSEGLAFTAFEKDRHSSGK